MKNKTIAILLLATTISISGCGGCSQNTDTTEAVNETESIIETEEPTETEEIAVETETTEAPSEVADEMYQGFSSENITINSDGTREYSEAFYNECRNYNCFEGATDEQIKKMVDKFTNTEYKAEDYHNEFTNLDKLGMTVYDYLNIPNPNKTKDSSESSTNSNSTTNNSNTTNTNSNSSKDNTESNNTSSTPSQDTDTTKGYGDAGGNSPSEAPVQSVDDGAPDVDISSLMGQHQWSENDGSTGLIQ